MTVPSATAVGPQELDDQPTSRTRDWLRHIGMLNDYVRIPYANGSSFASQFLYREFRAQGHRVTVVGPSDADAHADELPEQYVMLKSLPLRNHPGVFAAGEMLDWEAPTGGYLLQACFSTGVAAANGALSWLR